MRSASRWMPSVQSQNVKESLGSNFLLTLKPVYAISSFCLFVFGPYPFKQTSLYSVAAGEQPGGAVCPSSLLPEAIPPRPPPAEKVKATPDPFFPSCECGGASGGARIYCYGI